MDLSHDRCVSVESTLQRTNEPSAGILINGPGTSLNSQVCHSVMMTCVVVYFLAKTMIYFMLGAYSSTLDLFPDAVPITVERLYVVWPNRGTRLSSLAWRISMLVVPGYIAVALYFVSRTSYRLSSDETHPRFRAILSDTRRYAVRRREQTIYDRHAPVL